MFARIAVLAAVAGALLALYLTGAFELITDEVRAREAIEAAGLWAPVLYVLAFSLGEPFFIPGFAFIIPGSVAFDYVELVILSWLGSIGAGIVGFSFARFVGRDFVSKRLPPRLRRYDDRLATHGLRTVIVVRLTLFLLPPAHWLLGLSQVRFVPFVLGTAIGFLPGIALLTYVVVFLGNNFGELLKDRPPGFFLGLAVVVVVFIRLRRRWQKRRDEAEPPDTAVAPLDEA